MVRMDEIKAISLWQPWASLVIGGHKQFETRSWRTRYRGLLAIHAARSKAAGGLFEQEPFHTGGFRRRSVRLAATGSGAIQGTGPGAWAARALAMGKALGRGRRMPGDRVWGRP